MHTLNGGASSWQEFVDAGLRTRLPIHALDDHRAVQVAHGGASVGEPTDEMLRIMTHAPPLLPAHQPRYLVGVGPSQDLVEGVAGGAGMSDCVMPTRNARNGRLFTRFGDRNIRNARCKEDTRPIDETRTCPACAGGFSRAYRHHLDRCGEMLGPTLDPPRFDVTLKRTKRAVVVNENSCAVTVAASTPIPKLVGAPAISA